MINCIDWPVGVCTRSLHNNVAEINRIRKKTGLNCLHLGLEPLMKNVDEEYLEMAQSGDWKITAAMVGFPQEDYSTLDSIRKTGGIIPKERWEDNKQRVIKAVELTGKLKVNYLSFHFGFLDFSNRSYMDEFKGKVRMLADKAGECGVTILMETGQETAAELHRFITEMSHKALGVNFDPANMILYGKGNPIDAVDILMPWVRHVHIKDAIGTKIAGQWGKEVAWGQGQVNSNRFLVKLRESGYCGALAIEREAGQNRQDDIESAIEKLEAFSTRFV